MWFTTISSSLRRQRSSRSVRPYDYPERSLQGLCHDWLARRIRCRPVELIKAMTVVQSRSSTHTSSISQAAAVEALNGPQDFIAPHNKTFKHRRDLVVSMLNRPKALPYAGRRVLRLSVLRRRHRQNHARRHKNEKDPISAPIYWIKVSPSFPALPSDWNLISGYLTPHRTRPSAVNVFSGLAEL